MHIYFSGIGGAGIGPLAEIALAAGYEVSGSDKQNSSYIEHLRESGITDIYLDQSYNSIAQVHKKHPIDWLIYTSALPLEQPNAPELRFATDEGIKQSKRDELINQITKDNSLSLIAVAGTHGKTTTTAIITWLCYQHQVSISYLLPAKTSFGPMGRYQKGSHYFVFEADEFDRNFLQFEPWLSVITGVSWDHHEIFPSRESYQQAFKEFISQSEQTLIWQDDALYLGLNTAKNLAIQDPAHPQLSKLKLKGLYNRLDGWLALQTLLRICDVPATELIESINLFPGLSRRMEEIVPGLYSDYAHTPEKIRAAMSVAKEMAKPKQAIVIIYEPLTNRRQHYMINDYKDSFAGAAQVYWLPSYLAREDPNQRILAPAELISRLSDPTIALPATRNSDLKRTIDAHLNKGDMVIAMAGGGGGSLDDWLREQYYV
ncbi:Mur ligase domain-containing protein [Patescibacteria group bacterium]|jgi:UDP-N-acetylmuramate--alanine ligase|nr:Mur ligase domain-containing protein [Patescibacteria group bacterium]